jgi:hypothetical protein
MMRSEGKERRMGGGGAVDIRERNCGRGLAVI